MASPFARLAPEFDVPPQPLGFADGGGRPPRRGDLRDKEVPSQERQLGLGGGLAALAGGFTRVAAPFVDPGLGHAGGKEAHGSSCLGAPGEGSLAPRLRCGAYPRRQLHGASPPSAGLKGRRWRLRAGQKSGRRRRTPRQGRHRAGASSKEQPRPPLGELAPRGDLFSVWGCCGDKGHVGKPGAALRPDELTLGPGPPRPAASPRKAVLQRRG